MKLSNALESEHNLYNFIVEIVKDIKKADKTEKDSTNDIVTLVYFIHLKSKLETAKFIESKLNSGDDIDNIIDVIIEQTELSLENFE